VVVLVVVVVIVVLEVIEVVEVIVIIVIILVTVEDDERGGDVVRVEEGVVVRVEGGGQLLGGGVQRRVVVTSGGGSGLVVTFEGGDQRSESGARIRVHGWTVPRPTAEWTARRAASRSRSGSGRATAPDASRPSPRTGGQSDPTPHCARRGHPAREQPARAARSARRTGPPRRGLRVPDHHGAARVLGLAGARGARRAGRVRPLGACPHPGVPRRGPAHLDAATDHPGQLDTGLKVTGLSDAGTNGTGVGALSTSEHLPHRGGRGSGAMGPWGLPTCSSSPCWCWSICRPRSCSPGWMGASTGCRTAGSRRSPVHAWSRWDSWRSAGRSCAM